MGSLLLADVPVINYAICFFKLCLKLEFRNEMIFVATFKNSAINRSIHVYNYINCIGSYFGGHIIMCMKDCNIMHDHMGRRLLQHWLSFFFFFFFCEDHVFFF